MKCSLFNISLSLLPLSHIHRHTHSLSLTLNLSLSLPPSLSPVAPVAPIDISIEGVGPTWIYLDWFQPSAGLGNPPLSGHVVTVQEVGAEEEERRFEGSTAKANVTGLQPGTEYAFSVVAVSEFGDVQAFSPPSAPANGTTTFTGEIYPSPTLYLYICLIHSPSSSVQSATSGGE